MGNYAGIVNSYPKGNSTTYRKPYVKLDYSNVRVIMHDRFNRWERVFVSTKLMKVVIVNGGLTYRGMNILCKLVL